MKERQCEGEVLFGRLRRRWGGKMRGDPVANGSIETDGSLKDPQHGVDANPSFGNQNGSQKPREMESRRRRRPQKKKKKKKEEDCSSGQFGECAEQEKLGEEVEVEYITEKPQLDDEMMEQFKGVFDKFTVGAVEAAPCKSDDKERQEAGKEKDSEEDEEEKQPTISNRKKKLQNRMSVAELKLCCSRPEVVEVWDTAAPDPKLLVSLKSYRNTVPVPRHWCQKRKFLQGKRGMEKQPFRLPDFIATTGIENLRQAYIEKEDCKKLKQKQRERMRPKTGKILDIDYMVLHDAFFKYQTKPKLTGHGDVYYEGKEFEERQRKMKPGVLSQQLKEALGMRDGLPPPWLINMQRYGPPPSYPQLRIPGLNAPIPGGAFFGYQAGGWGMPPVDLDGRPLYGDVFGAQPQSQRSEEPVDRSKHWGDLAEEEEEEEEQEEEEEAGGVGEEELEGGIASPDSVSAGVETPGPIDLRKQPLVKPHNALYQILVQKEERIAPGTLLGTTHTYALGDAHKTDARKVKSDQIDITLRPEEVEALDDVALAAKYKEAKEAERIRNQREDFSDMVAEVENRRKRKMQEKQGLVPSKKRRDFKF